MWILRKIVQSCLPRFWRDQIDLEARSIRELVVRASGRITSGERLLDAGAGQAPYRKYFRHTKYTAVDFGKGEQAWDYGNLDAVARLESLPFPDCTFDMVLSTQVLEHVCEPGQVMDDLFRVLKPGGRLFLSAPLGFGEHQQPHDYYRFTRYALAHLLEQSGFELRSIEPRGGFFWYMAVMSMWFYLYFFPAERHVFWKIVLFPLQIIAALWFVFIGPPLISLLDFLDREKAITLGFAVEARKPGNDPVKKDLQ
ncbi:class I SAM-dependent methyltransferase [bacterium]|nr:class I SAM-dependent methyltransferase [candidate division CSSED10-310 bacterium]